MSYVIDALYGGKGFRSIDPVELEPFTHGKITLESEEEEARSFLRAARELKLEGPEDWAFLTLVANL